MKKRAKKSEERREQRIYIRVTKTEKQQIQQAARANGTTVSRMIADLIMKKHGTIQQEQTERETPTVAELKRVRKEIWRIGTNINQIAHRVNQEIRVTPDDIATSHRDLDRCKDMINEITRIIGQQQTNGENDPA